MFDYRRWRMWLESKATELASNSIRTNVRFADDISKPGMGLELEGVNTIASFQTWITGETDYTIHEIASLRDVRPASHKWGLIVSDETFEVIFDEFLREFRRHEN